jgi:NADPH2:quinone reductase
MCLERRNVRLLASRIALLKGCEIVGVTWGGFLQRDLLRTRAHLDELATLYAVGKLRPTVTVTYPLERATDALMELMERRVKGKIAIVPEESAPPGLYQRFSLMSR